MHDERDEAYEEKSVVGSIINFRGMIYSPINEQGVVLLFGKILKDLNMYEIIRADILVLEKETGELLSEIVGGGAI